MKKILGLDLGTNSIGWAVVSNDENKNHIEAVGSRIIPMDATTLGNFNEGKSISQTADRTKLRSTRRLLERSILRRERLHRVLDCIGFLPKHFSESLDRYGKFKDHSEPKLAWNKLPNQPSHFLFQDSFNEMVSDFKKNQPQLFNPKSNGEERKIPYDWTIFYLRKKALTRKIAKEELAWLLLNFNQKRGYYQLREENDDEKPNKLVELHSLKVISVKDTGDKKDNMTWYDVTLENGWIYHRKSTFPLDWVGKVKDFIVTTDLSDDGTPKKDKNGEIKRSFRAPSEDDWTLVKKKTELDIQESKKTVGEYIYETLLQKPNQKIKGQLIRTIERKFYKQELEQILKTQTQFHPELKNKKLYEDCINELYQNNQEHRQNIGNRDFVHLFLNDILFYQRPLKSKKSQISDCPYEVRKDDQGTEYPVKCISKSHPLFQEFRLWQFVANLKIYQNEKMVDNQLKYDVDVTEEFLSTEDKKASLFEWLNSRKEVKQDDLLVSYLKIKKPKKGESCGFRWNYVEDKAYPCNETRTMILSRLNKLKISADFLSRENEENLWHIFYSIKDKEELKKSLQKFADKNGLETNFIDVFLNFPAFKNEYGSYSAKAIKNLLPLMRMGSYWNGEAINNHANKDRIDKIITGEFDETIRIRVREKAINLETVENFKGLPLWLACYIVYDRHSEAKDISKWKSPDDINNYLKTFKQHSLRNPIVEQVVMETLRTVRDIWSQVGQIDEIHVELGREMKNPADKRKRMTEQVNENENTNLRIKALLAEFANGANKIEGVRPYSQSQQEVLKIYESFAVANITENDDKFAFVSKISKSSNPSQSDIQKYKLWLEQKYRSPYTGRVIPLSQVFTSRYEIEHVIPQSRYFDDSLSNKVICESEVNKLKDKQLGYEFIVNHHEQIVTLSGGKTVKIFSVEQYEAFVKEHYVRNKSKKEKLLLKDIPDSFIERQLNDTRYISKFIKGLLSNIVRDEGEDEAISKNVIPCSGGTTDVLKNSWGLNDVWNSIILPRFMRLNEIHKVTHFVTNNREGHPIPSMPLQFQKGFNKKRIDHRHHAMDAIVIACTSRNHVNLLNNESAKSNNSENRYKLSRILRKYETRVIEKDGEKKTIDVATEFKKPWDSFTTDAKMALETMIVSIKQNQRVINKTTNRYYHYENGEKVLATQTKGDHWSVRKPMHKDTVYGEVNLRQTKTTSFNEALKNPSSIVNRDFKKKIIAMISEGLKAKDIKHYFENNKDVWSDINLSKIEIYYFSKDSKDRYFATRKGLASIFSDGTGNVLPLEKCKKSIETITDTGIQKILLNYCESNESKGHDYIFSQEGIDNLNLNIAQYNQEKSHQAIHKVRVYEQANKNPVGQAGNKSQKYVESAKGTNLFFAVYEQTTINKKTSEKSIKRTYATIPLNVVIQRQKQGLDSVPADENGIIASFVLSPNDLVYVPTPTELKNGILVIDKERIYKMVSATESSCFFIKNTVASSIVDKQEFTTLNKMEKAITGEMIKAICVPIKVDRLGNILKLGS